MSEVEQIFSEWRARKLAECESCGCQDPPVCVLGHQTYAALCGAIAILYGITGNVKEFQGCKLYVARSLAEGMFFGNVIHEPSEDEFTEGNDYEQL